MDTVVATTVEDLTVRAAPGLDGERLGTPRGRGALVPRRRTDRCRRLPLVPRVRARAAAEHRLRRARRDRAVQLPVLVRLGRRRSESGEPWLVAHELACPQAPHTAENIGIGRTSIERLACFGADPFTFRGYWPEIPDDAGLGWSVPAQDEPSGWLLCQHINYNNIVIDDSEDMFGIGIDVSIDPESGVTMPERGTWVEVRVHLDDPDAQSCDEDAAANGDDETPPEQLVLNCRAEAVLEAARGRRRPLTRRPPVAPSTNPR